MLLFLAGLFVLGWAAAAILGTQAYFRGEQSKPIHERNWRSEGFETLAQSITGQETDYNQRTPGYGPLDAYTSSLIPTE